MATTLDDTLQFPAPPQIRSNGLSKRQLARPTIDVHAASLTVPSTSQITPPQTPATAGLQIESESQPDGPTHAHLDDDEPEPLFANYLRAFYHFHPTSPVSSVAEGSSVTIAINAGDVIFVHSIQPNGWADGTLLSSGARGWLPTNYCEAYDHDIIRNLLNALNNVWDFIRGHEDGAQLSVFAKQDYVRGMIAGVRVFLERAKCLSRDSPLIQSHAALRRMRKGILGELSSFVKAARLLQEVCNSPIAPEALYDILDDIVLKAFKVVTRAIRFLDSWSEEVFLQQSDMQPPGVSLLASDHAMPPTPPAEELHHLRQMQRPQSDLPTPDELSAELTAMPGDLRPAARTSLSLSKGRSSSRLSSAFTPTPRPSSIASKRASASHRWSHGNISKRASALRSVNLVSEQLCAAHDTFLSSLGAYIGLHMQSRWSMDLLVTTQQSVNACQSLLALIDEVWDRDHRRSDALVEARDTMHTSLGELVQATRDIFNICDSPDDPELCMPDQGKRLVDAATLCVRSAGECVTKTRTVIERIGDFEWDPTVASLHERWESQTSAGDANVTAGSSSTSAFADDQQQHQHDRKLSKEAMARKSLPPLPLEDAQGIDIPTAEPSPSFFKTEGRDPTMVPAPLRTVASGILRAASAASGETRSSMDTVVPHDRSARASTISKRAPSVDFTLHRRSSIVMSDSEALSADVTPLTSARVGSTGVSNSDSSSTYMNSFRNSEQSMVSQVSTRATTPDPEADKQLPDMNASTTSLTGSHEDGSLPEEHDDAAEEQFLAKTYAHELVFNKDGQVTGGSLPALVERLTTHDSTPDAMFVNTFYLTFRLFTTPTEFAQALVDRFEFAGDAQDFATPVRLRVYNVFKGWLESHWQPDTDAEALRTILRFATGRLKDCLPSASRRLIELTTKVSETSDRDSIRLVSSFGKTTLSANAPISPDSPTPPAVISKSQLSLLRNVKEARASASILDFDALELARQITLIESKIFSAIQPEELLAQEWIKKTDSKAFNVKAKSALSTDLANLVADSILSLEEPKKRATIIRQWIKIGRKLLELNNYDSLMAVICSLNSSMVERLKRTWECVPAKTLAKLEELKTIVDVSKNHATLRAKLQGVVAPCLPFVGMYLTDLTFVDVGNQTTRTLSHDDTKVINFDKHVKTARIISDLQRFQIPYKLAPVPELQEWMEMQIHRMRESDQANVQNYYRRSLALEPREAVRIITTNLQSKSSPAMTDNVPPTPTLSKPESVKEKLDFWNQFHFPSSKFGSGSS